MTFSRVRGVPVECRHASRRALLALAAAALILSACLPVQGGGTQASFKIAGSTKGLYPGGRVPLVLKVTNPDSFAIVVTSLTVRVGRAGPRCRGANVSIPAFSGRLKVAAHKSARVTLHATLLHSAPNGCEGARFPLHYRGRARKA
ncbi:MAG: hypothetical protein ACLPQS_16435 [Acidimicrobiales bacterium]